MTYKFEHLNGGLEITPTSIEIDPVVKEANPIDMTISVGIKLFTETRSAGFYVLLEDVKVNNLNYDADTLTERVLERLNDFKI